MLTGNMSFMPLLQCIILALPLVFVLLLLAFMPLIANNFWQKYEKFVLFCVAAFSITCCFIILDSAKHIIYDAVVLEYLPFIATLFVLYSLSSGIKITLSASSSTVNNALFLLCGSIFSSIIGTTGASMLLLPPFLKMNEARKNKKHLIVFFIFLVSNIGGLLTPLGDPPLLIGYIKGIEFFWFFKNLFPIWLFFTVSCLIILCIIDIKLIKFEILQKQRFAFKMEGLFNIILLCISVVVMFLPCNQIIRYSVLLLLVIFASLYNKHSNINYKPFLDVAATFCVIFIVLAPVIFLLNKYSDSIYDIIHLTNEQSRPSLFFWLCSAASSFLDNAPSFLLFFNIACGNAVDLMTQQSILTAIASGAVVMGAMTYIGNAPNMMVKAYSQHCNIEMPSFLKYMLYSITIILPLSIIANKIFW